MGWQLLRTMNPHCHVELQHVAASGTDSRTGGELFGETGDAESRIVPLSAGWDLAFLRKAARRFTVLQ